MRKLLVPLGLVAIVIAISKLPATKRANVSHVAQKVMEH